MPDAQESIELPRELLDQLLARVQDLGELKAVLAVIRLSQGLHVKGAWLDDLLSPETLRDVVGTGSPEPAEVRMRRSLNRATANGFLYQLVVGPSHRVRYLPATASNRQLVEQFRRGDQAASLELEILDSGPVAVYRPNVYALYERHLGPLTPLVAEQLRLAERAYPRAWIEAAIEQAAHYGRRHWRYVESILRRWEETGAPDALFERGP